MTCRRIGRLIRRVLLIMVLLPLVWALGVSLMPTDWVRSRLESRLCSHTGQLVRVGSVRLGVFGGLQIREIEIAQPETASRPWLSIGRVQAKSDLANLLKGTFCARLVDLQHVIFIAERHQGGSFPFVSLLRSRGLQEEKDPSKRQGDFAQAGTDCSVVFRVRDAKVVIDDEPTSTHLEITGIEGRGAWSRDRAVIRDVQGRISSGTLALEAEVERYPDGPMFEGQIVASGVPLRHASPLMAYLVPVISGSGQELDGRLDMNLYLRGQGESTAALAQSLVGQGALRIEPITLRESPLVTELTRVLRLPEDLEVGSVKSTFGIVQERIHSKDMLIELGGLPVCLSGTTDFRGVVDYKVRSRALVEVVAPEIRGWLSELWSGGDDAPGLRLQGDPRHLRITFEGLPLETRSGKSITDEESLREMARQLKERFLR